MGIFIGILIVSCVKSSLTYCGGGGEHAERERERRDRLERVERGCRSWVDKPRGWTRAPLRTASTWRTVSPIPFFPWSPSECRPESERACRTIDFASPLLVSVTAHSIGSLLTCRFRDSRTPRGESRIRFRRSRPRVAEGRHQSAFVPLETVN